MRSYAATIIGTSVLAIGLSPAFVQAADQKTTDLPPCPPKNALEYNMPFVEHDPFTGEILVNKAGMLNQKPLPTPPPLKSQPEKAHILLCIDATA